MILGEISMNSLWVIAGAQTISIHTYVKRNNTLPGSRILRSEGVVRYILLASQYIQRDLLKKNFFDGNVVWVHIISHVNSSTFLLIRAEQKSTWVTSASFTLSACTMQPLHQRCSG